MVYVYVSNASFAVELQCVNVQDGLCLFSKWNFYPKEAVKSDVVQEGFGKFSRCNFV